MNLLEHGIDCYLVGGAGRDELLGRAVVDRDWVVVGARREDLLALGFLQVGKDFPVFLHPKSGEEYAAPSFPFLQISFPVSTSIEERNPFSSLPKCRYTRLFTTRGDVVAPQNG